MSKILIHEIRDSFMKLKHKIIEEQDMTKPLPQTIVRNIDEMHEEIRLIEERMQNLFKKIEECEMHIRILG